MGSRLVCSHFCGAWTKIISPAEPGLIVTHVWRFFALFDIFSGHYNPQRGEGLIRPHNIFLCPQAINCDILICQDLSIVIILWNTLSPFHYISSHPFHYISSHLLSFLLPKIEFVLCISSSLSCSFFSSWICIFWSCTTATIQMSKWCMSWCLSLSSPFSLQRHLLTKTKWGVDC